PPQEERTGSLRNGEKPAVELSEYESDTVVAPPRPLRVGRSRATPMQRVQVVRRQHEAVVERQALDSVERSKDECIGVEIEDGSITEQMQEQLRLERDAQFMRPVDRSQLVNLPRTD